MVGLALGDEVVNRSMKALHGLIGTWHGNGQGRFPTIDSFTYDEETEFICNDVEPLIRYEQRTWDTTHRTDHAEPLHWEVGFIRPTEDGHIEISNTQNNGRVEVLRGLWTPPIDGTPALLVLDSIVHAHDERMVRTWRRYEIDATTMRYECSMATRNTPERTPHLTATLTKQ